MFKLHFIQLNYYPVVESWEGIRFCFVLYLYENRLVLMETNIEIYQLEDGKTEIAVQLENETVWLSLNQMVDLFGRDKSVISRHIKNVFREKELEQNSVVAKNAKRFEQKNELLKELQDSVKVLRSVIDFKPLSND